MCQKKNKQEVRGLVRIEDCVDAAIKGLENYIKKSKERQITAANNSNGNRESNKI